MSFSPPPPHYTKLNLADPSDVLNLENWLLAEQPAWGQLHVRVSTAACCWTVLLRQQARDAHVVVPIKADALYYRSGSTRGGKGRGEWEPALCWSPVSGTLCFVVAFNMCRLLREGSSEMSTFCWALHPSGEPNLLSLIQAPRCLVSVWPITPTASTVVLQHEGLKTRSSPQASCLQTCPHLKERCLWG